MSSQQIRYSQPMTVDNGGCTVCSVLFIIFVAFFSISINVIGESNLWIRILCISISITCLIIGCCVCSHIIKTRRRQRRERTKHAPSNASTTQRLDRIERLLAQQSNASFDMHSQVLCLIIILFTWLQLKHY